jgi:HYR domain-containing protein
MHPAVLRRSAVLAIVTTLVVAGVASADAVRADGDVIAPGAQTTIDLGDVAPGAIVTIPVGFELTCAGTSHPDRGQTITMSLLVASPAPGGAVISVVPGEIAPIPDSWVADGATCPDPSPRWSDGAFSIVTLRAPTVPSVDYVYTIGYARAIAPAGNDDANAVRGAAPTVTIHLDVVTNSAPVLTLPGDQTVEGDTTGGWSVAYPGVIATDAEDDPDPTPTCSPAPGTLLGLGLTTVSCSVTDSGGRSANGTFAVTVVDTTSPVLSAMPDDLAVVTGDPAGITLTYAQPSASDLVDATPSVACAPSSGSQFGPGSTTVVCTATDDSGNSSTASFVVNVTFVPTHVAAVVWREPVGPGTTIFTATHGRTIPVKAELSVDGQTRSEGTAELRVAQCDGGGGLIMPMTYHGGRWTAPLDTSSLTGPCHVVSAWIDGLEAGSFRLELRDDEGASTNHSAQDAPTVKAKDQSKNKPR